MGKPIFLPASFTGGPRHLHQCYLDSMTLVSTFGRPGFFITMTASPKWKEVQANLRPGEQAHNRPDLMARVFREKLKHLLHVLTVEGWLGKTVAHTYVIEFQKRGLPHAHILLIMAKESTPKSPADIDRVVSAEIPTGENETELRVLVEGCMMHGPCGDMNPNCPCMRDGVCTKKYPKEFLETTVWCENGYPSYRRREFAGGHRIVSSNGLQDNRWVVPYNKRLLNTFKCHLNVEVCSSIKAVKYLYKYTYKGREPRNAFS